MLRSFFVFHFFCCYIVSGYYCTGCCLLSAKHYKRCIKCCDQSSRNQGCSFTYGYGECVIAAIHVAAICLRIPYFCNENNPTKNGPHAMEKQNIWIQNRKNWVKSAKKQITHWCHGTWANVCDFFSRWLRNRSFIFHPCLSDMAYGLCELGTNS